jgi:hypothetical protein
MHFDEVATTPENELTEDKLRDNPECAQATKDEENRFLCRGHDSNSLSIKEWRSCNTPLSVVVRLGTARE